jgi:coenzyme F420-reducing hydrogenase delta subunit
MDGVIVVGCHVADCHYITGVQQTLKMVPSTKKRMEKIAVDPERLVLEFCSAAEGAKFSKVINDFSAKVEKLGSFELSSDQERGLRQLIEKSKKAKKDRTKQN